MSNITDNATVEAVAEEAKVTKNKAKEIIEHWRNRVHDTIEHSGERLHDTYDKVAETSLKDVEAATIRYVRRKPMKSLAIAAGVGFVAGLLIRGRH